MLRRWTTLLLVSGACASVTPSAFAQAKDPQTEIAEARALRDKGDLAGARARLSALFEATHSAVAGYELGVTLRAMGDLNGAYDILAQVRELTPTAPEEIEAQKAAASLFVDVDAAIPMVGLELSAVLPDVTRVTIDGVDVPRDEWGNEQPVNPGKHVVLVHLTDGTALKKVFTISERARARLRFKLPGAPAAAATAAPQPKPLTCEPGAKLERDSCVRLLGSYTYQVAIVDGVFTIAYAIGIGGESVPTGLIGAGGLALGGPIVHWAHGRVGRGFASLGLHMAGIVASVAFVSQLEEPTGNSTAGIIAASAGLIGFGLDALVLRHNTDEVRTAPKPAAFSFPSIALSPIRGGAAASVAFTF